MDMKPETTTIEEQQTFDVDMDEYIEISDVIETIDIIEEEKQQQSIDSKRKIRLIKRPEDRKPIEYRKEPDDHYVIDERTKKPKKIIRRIRKQPTEQLIPQTSETDEFVEISDIVETIDEITETMDGQKIIRHRIKKIKKPEDQKPIEYKYKSGDHILLDKMGKPKKIMRKPKDVCIETTKPALIMTRKIPDQQTDMIIIPKEESTLEENAEKLTEFIEISDVIETIEEIEITSEGDEKKIHKIKLVKKPEDKLPVEYEVKPGEHILIDRANKPKKIIKIKKSDEKVELSDDEKKVIEFVEITDIIETIDEEMIIE
ncbi:hypothetical protein BLA29_005840, partial [Euroglyphus maynei]